MINLKFKKFQKHADVNGLDDVDKGELKVYIFVINSIWHLEMPKSNFIIKIDKITES